jgi:hypothetical protein
LKWDLKVDDRSCAAMITVGTLTAAANKPNKRHAKVAAARALLKTIDSNVFLKDKFFFHIHDHKEDHGKYSKKANKNYSEPVYSSENEEHLDPKAFAAEELHSKAMALDVNAFVRDDDVRAVVDC